jgi:Zn-dependent protease with chaperone function
LAQSGLNEEQLRAVIAHELAHIRRLDAFVDLFQMLVETVSTQ